jgi:hypothetical protein
MPLLDAILEFFFGWPYRPQPASPVLFDGSIPSCERPDPRDLVQ